MTSPKSSKLTWDNDGKTTQAPSQSQQRAKLSWDDDASTVTAPASIKLPAAAYRPADEATPPPTSVDVTARPAPQAAPLADLITKALDESATQPPAPPVPAPSAEPPAPARAARRWRRWLVLALALPLFYALGYTAVRVTQKLQQDPSTQLRPALTQVLAETLDQVKQRFPGSEQHPASR